MLGPALHDVVNKEVDKLISAEFIREIQYPVWITNIVVVLKKNEKIRVCIDFTNLNRACPKDSFPLPRIEKLIDAAAGHELMSFMDGYSGYNNVFYGRLLRL